MRILPSISVRFSRIWSRIKADQAHFASRITAIQSSLITYQCGSTAFCIPYHCDSVKSSWAVTVRINRILPQRISAVQSSRINADQPHISARISAIQSSLIWSRIIAGQALLGPYQLGSITECTRITLRDKWDSTRFQELNSPDNCLL